MFQLLKDWLNFKVRMKHLKHIDKEIKKCHRMNTDYEAQVKFIRLLIQQYDEKYKVVNKE